MTVEMLVTAGAPVPQVRLDLDLLKNTVAEGTTDDEFKLFVKVCERTGLDPFARQIYAIVPRRKRGDEWVRDYSKPVRTQTSIDGYRLIAERTGKYAGRLGPYWCGADGKWLMDAEGRPLPWLNNEAPSASMVGILRHGFTEPLYAIARFKSYVQTNYEGKPTGQWVKGEDLMIGKCAEALALRGAFPQELSGLYTEDELGQMDNAAEPHAPSPTPATRTVTADGEIVNGDASDDSADPSTMSLQQLTVALEAAGLPLTGSRASKEQALRAYRANVDDVAEAEIVAESDRSVSVNSAVDAEEAEAAPERIYLEVPFPEKEEAKAAGARWDKSAKAWFIPEGGDPIPLLKWVPEEPSLFTTAAPCSLDADCVLVDGHDGDCRTEF